MKEIKKELNFEDGGYQKVLDKKIHLRICTMEDGTTELCMISDCGSHMVVHGKGGKISSYKDIYLSSHRLSNALVNCSDFILKDLKTGETLRTLTS